MRFTGIIYPSQRKITDLSSAVSKDRPRTVVEIVLFFVYRVQAFNIIVYPSSLYCSDRLSHFGCLLDARRTFNCVNYTD